MYNEYFGLRQAPFRITPDTALFYTGGGRGDVLDALVYAITSGEGIVKVIGEVGTGKTMLCRMLEERLPANVQIAYLANPSLTPQDILHAVALELELDVAADANRLRVMHRLQETLLSRHADNHRVVLLVEEAQSMPVDTLEEIRLLSNLETKNEKLLQIVLFGQPELDENLAQPQIRQLRERITHSFSLTPLGREEVRDYVAFRLRASGYHGRDAFTSKAYRAMSRGSEGLTRRVNIIADKAMLAAFADDTHDVSAKHVKSAIADSEFSSTRTRKRQSPRAAIAAGVLAAVVLAGAGGWYAGNQASSVVASSQTQLPMSAQSSATAQQQHNPQPQQAAQVPAPPSPRAPVMVAAAVADNHVEAPAVTPPAPATSSPKTSPENSQERFVSSITLTAPASAPAATPAPSSSAVVSTPASPQPIADQPITDQPTTTQPVTAASVEPAQNPAASNDDVIEQALAVARASPGAQAVAAGAGPAAQVDSAASSTVAESPLDRPVPESDSAQRDGAAGRDSGSVASASGSGPTAARASVAAEVASSRPAAIEQRPIAAASGKREHETLLQWRLAQTLEWLRTVSKDHYSIQLLATDSRQRRNLEAFLSRRERGGDIGQIFVYRARIKAREWYGVLFGEFVSYTQAREALRELPRELRLHQPFIRNIKDINALS